MIAKDSLTEIIFCTNDYKIYVSSWWTVVFLRGRYPKSYYVMLPEVEAHPDTEVQGEILFTSLNSVPKIHLLGPTDWILHKESTIKKPFQLLIRNWLLIRIPHSLRITSGLNS